MNLKASLVLTTINNPLLLKDYYNNFEKYERLNNIKTIIIPDRKTPKEAFDTYKDLEKKGMNIDFISIDQQEKYLKKFHNLREVIPYNSDNRRNIGYLMAYESRVDFLISIDDDNYPIMNEDYFEAHSVVCSPKSQFNVLESGSNWFNICSLLEYEPNVEVYPRGFPYFERRKKVNLWEHYDKVQIKINAGLWIGEPDLDGITWLSIPVKTNAFKNKDVVISKNTWSPINTQNTALSRDVIPSYYFVKMGYPIHGFNIDRYGDIFSGYFSQKCAKMLDHFVKFGKPIAEHKRNSHNYLNDATNELACIWILEDLLPWLIEVKLEGDSYLELYESLSYKIEEFAEKQVSKFWTEDVKGYFHQIAYNMRIWLNACKTIIR